MKPDIENLLRDLGSEEWWIRDKAIKSLLDYPENTYIDFIERALKNHDDATIRNAAMEFYSQLGKRALTSLLRLLRDEDKEIRIFAANILGEIKDKEAIGLLVERLEDPDVNVRMAAAEALGKIGDASAITALSKVVHDEPWVAMAAIKSIGEIGGDYALDILYDALTLKDYRGITFEAIEQAGDPKAIERLTPFVDNDDMRELAIKAIVNIAEKKGVKIEPEYFISLLPVLVELQGSPNAEIRKASLTAMSWMKDARVIPYLLKALEKEDLQDYAISGILNVGKRAIPEIIAALREKDRPYRNLLARILLLFGEELSLMQFYNDDDPEVRTEVALALGNIKSKEAFRLLSILRDDPEEEVRLAAEKSIKLWESHGRYTTE